MTIIFNKTFFINLSPDLYTMQPYKTTMLYGVHVVSSQILDHLTN